MRPHQQRIWFTGCTHFGHTNILKLANRPFETINEHDEALKANWNALVQEHDIVYHLGDFSWKAYDPILTELKGHIVRVRGNHDSHPPGILPYFDLRVCDLPGYATHAVARRARRIVMFHYPIEEWDGWYQGTLHVHAHTHRKDPVSAPRRFNVGVDATEYRPISLDELLDHPNAVA